MKMIFTTLAFAAMFGTSAGAECSPLYYTAEAAEAVMKFYETGRTDPVEHLTRDQHNALYDAGLAYSKETRKDVGIWTLKYGFKVCTKS